MKLSRKVFLYTAGTTFLVGLLIIGYFMFMLPGLFVDYKSERFMQQVEDVQAQIVRGEYCDNTMTDNLYLISIALPDEGYDIISCNQYYNATIEIVRPELRNMLDSLRSTLTNITSGNATDFENIDFENLEFNLEIDGSFLEEISREIQLDSLVSVKNFESKVSFIDESTTITDMKQTADGSVLISSEIRDETNHYTSYVAFNRKDGMTYLTLASTMTPQLTELTPIIMTSVPMILLVLLLFTLITASIFSRSLAEPIETLARQARTRKNSKTFRFKQKHQHDEFKVLEEALNQMHQDVQTTMDQLQTQNQELQNEKEKQKLFMMNASHQLKTPIAGASLLVESMSQKVGKFADTDTYLPAVQQELSRISNIIEKVLSTFADTNKALEEQNIAVDELLTNILSQFREQIVAKELTLETNIQTVTLNTDPTLLASIVENILLNAIRYTPAGNRVVIDLTPEHLTIFNAGVEIEPELLPRIQEAFVRSKQQEAAGSGLGLYLVDTFVQMLGMTWTIQNASRETTGVQVTINFEKGREK